MKPLTLRSGPRETQPIALQALQPKFIAVYGNDVDNKSQAFIDKLLKDSSLLPHVLHADGLTASETIRRITRVLQLDSHLLLCVHGMAAQVDTPAGKRTRHYSTLEHRGHPTISTAALIRKIMGKLKPPAEPGSAGGDRPFIYLYSCMAGAMSTQIPPGSALWKSAYLLLFSGSNSTCLSWAGSAVTGAVAYVDRCQRSGQAVDPMKLMLFAGMRSCERVTLMGGELAAPLVWRAPRSLQDMSDAASMKRLCGSTQDLARFHQAIGTLRDPDRRLLPVVAPMELLCNRLMRDDADQVAELLAVHPNLVAEASTLGELPLCTAAKVQASGCLEQLLKAGADPNMRESDGATPLMLCASLSDPQLANMKMLLAHGADPNLQDDDGFTALMIATHSNNLAAMQLLLTHGARTDLLALDGIGCLHGAALSNQLDTLALLLASGAGPSSGLDRELLADTVAAGHREAANMLRQALGDAVADQ